MLPKVYAIVDTAILERRQADPVAVAAAMIEGGIRLLQFRHKGAFTRSVFAQAEAIAALCSEAGTILVIDDRADIARLLDAAVHVGQEDLPPAAIRRIVGASIIGFSTHSEEQLRAGDQEPVDYLAIGPVFATSSKENPSPVIGLDRIAGLRALTDKPLVAIGGITRRTAPALWKAGIDSVAVISDLLPETLDAPSIRRRASEFVDLATVML